MDNFSANSLESVEATDGSPEGTDVADIAMTVFGHLASIRPSLDDVVARRG
jgi:hypothetical protein